MARSELDLVHGHRPLLWLLFALALVRFWTQPEYAVLVCRLFVYVTVHDTCF